MFNTTCNNTLEHESVTDETKLYGELTFHDVAVIVSGAFAAIAVVLSFFLMFMHATHYLKPWEQRHIIRILFMVPVYAVVSFLSLYYYKHYVYFQVIRDCYDAFAISSFFALLCSYIAPDLHAQKDYFRKLNPRNWLPPVNWFQRCCGAGRRQASKLTMHNVFFGGDSGVDRGLWRIPRSGLTWFNIIWLCIFQYCFTRVSFTIVSVITEAADKYCVESLSPVFAHVWAEVITAVAVSIAMFCLIQFYYQIRLDIQEYHPFLKLLSIKLVIFFVFWQTIILSFLNSSGAIKASAKIAQPDITVGIPALLIDIEMAIFAFLHIFAYPWKAYDVRTQMATAESGAGYSLGPSEYKGGPLGIKAFFDAFNPWDIFKAIGRGFRWAIIGRRNREQDISYQPGYQSGTPLQDASSVGNSKVKMGSYEPLDGEPDDNDAARYSPRLAYEPYHAQNGRPAPPGSLGPGRMGMGSTEAFAAAPLSRPGNVSQPVQGEADVAYHGAPPGELKMPEEDEFVHAR